MSLIRPDNAQVTARTLTRGLSGPKLDELAQEVAGEVVNLTGTTAGPVILSSRELAPIEADATTLRRNLAALLPQHSAHQSLMVAGALLSGTHGLILPDLAHALHDVARSPQKTAVLARQIEQVQSPKGQENSLGVALLQSLGLRTTQALVARHVPPAAMPAGMFLAGAMSRQLHNAVLSD